MTIAMPFNTITMLTIVGLLAFVVSMITEVTKEVGFLKKIPTAMQVIVTSLVLCVLSYLSYVSYYGIAVKWFYIFGSIVGSFVISFITMNGAASLGIAEEWGSVEIGKNAGLLLWDVPDYAAIPYLPGHERLKLVISPNGVLSTRATRL